MNELKELRQKYILLRRLTERDIERGWGHEAALLDRCQVLEILNDLRESFDEIDRLRADKERLIADYNDQQRIIAEANNLATDLMLERDRLRAQLATAVNALEAARLLAEGVRIGWHRSNTGQMLHLSMDRAAEWLDRWSTALERIKEGK